MYAHTRIVYITLAGESVWLGTKAGNMIIYGTYVISLTSGYLYPLLNFHILLTIKCESVYANKHLEHNPY